MIFFFSLVYNSFVTITGTFHFRIFLSGSFKYKVLRGSVDVLTHGILSFVMLPPGEYMIFSGRTQVRMYTPSPRILSDTFQNHGGQEWILLSVMIYFSFFKSEIFMSFLHHAIRLFRCFEYMTCHLFFYFFHHLVCMILWDIHIYDYQYLWLEDIVLYIGISFFLLMRLKIIVFPDDCNSTSGIDRILSTWSVFSICCKETDIYFSVSQKDFGTGYCYQCLLEIRSFHHPTLNILECIIVTAPQKNYTF